MGNMLQRCNLRCVLLHHGINTMQGSRRFNVLEVPVKLHHGFNVMQKSYTAKTHFDKCKRTPGISKGEAALSDQPANIVGGAMECRELQKRIDQLGVHTSSYTSAAVLYVLKNPNKKIYSLIVETTGNIDKCLDSLLVQMHIEDKALHQAHFLATKLPHLNLLVWNSLIGSYVHQELCIEAFQVFVLMQKMGVLPDNVTFVNALSACNSPFHLTRGKCLHYMIICDGCEIDVVLGTALLTMYSRCERLEDSARVFSFMEVRNVVSWTVMIGAHARDQNFLEAFHLHDRMKQEGTLPNRITFLNLLEACSCQNMLVNGKQLHSCIIIGVEFDMHITAALVQMYGKCGTFKDAQALFNLMKVKDVAMWNALMSASIRHKQYNEATQLFYSMMNEGLIPSVVTYVLILTACVHSTSSAGQNIHSYIISNELQDSVVVATVLMIMYGKLGCLDTALLLFDNMREQNVVSWNTMIALHAESGAVEVALQFLDKMQLQGLFANNVTYVSSLEAFAGKEALPAGKRLHCRIVESGYKTDVVVATAVANMYCRCGAFNDGHKVFNEMPKRNLISWNTMVSACCHYGYGMQGFTLFKQMQREGIVPDKVTYTSMLSLCANQLALLTLGRFLHYCIIYSGCEPDAVVATSLLDMYGKCGSLQDACKVFEKMSKQRVVHWNVIISNYAQHGCIEEAITMVDVMQQQGVTPNNVTFLSLLFACSHTGMLVEAYHNSLFMNICGIKARAEQFRCLIDLLGRAGRVEEAKAAIYKMPLDPSFIAWMALLGSCRHVIDVKQAEHIVEHIFEHDPGNSAAITLLASINC